MSYWKIGSLLELKKTLYFYKDGIETATTTTIVHPIQNTEYQFVIGNNGYKQVFKGQHVLFLGERPIEVLDKDQTHKNEYSVLKFLDDTDILFLDVKIFCSHDKEITNILHLKG